MRWLTSRLVDLRRRPVLAALVGSLVVVWSLMVAAQPGSTSYSLLANAVWFLLIATAVCAVVGPVRRRSRDDHARR